MERNQKIIILSVMGLLAAAILNILCIEYPVLFIVSPAITAFFILRFDKRLYASLSLFIGTCILCGIIYGFDIQLMIAFPLLIMGVGSGIFLAEMQKRKSAGFTTVFYTAILFGGALYLNVTLPGILNGTGAFSLLRESAKALTESLSHINGILPESLASGLSPEVLEKLPDYVTLTFVPCCCLLAGITSLCNFLLFRVFIKNKASEFGFAKISEFSLWSIPRSYSIGVLLIIAASFVFESSDPDLSLSLMLTGLVLFSVPFAIQGLSLIDWFIVKSENGIRRKRIITYILLGLFFRYTLTALIMIGTAEQAMKLRKRLILIRRRSSGPSDKGEKQ